MLSYIYASLGHRKRKLSDSIVMKLFTKLILILTIVHSLSVPHFEVCYSSTETSFLLIALKEGLSRGFVSQFFFNKSAIPSFKESNLLKKLSLSLLSNLFFYIVIYKGKNCYTIIWLYL